jgi:hypothetical protein
MKTMTAEDYFHNRLLKKIYTHEEQKKIMKEGEIIHVDVLKETPNESNIRRERKDSDKVGLKYLIIEAEDIEGSKFSVDSKNSYYNKVIAPKIISAVLEMYESQKSMEEKENVKLV